MFKFLNLQPEVFGLDISDSSLKIIKLEKRKNGFDLVSFNEVLIRPGILKERTIQNQDALAKIIRNACASVTGKKLDTNYVALALPEEKSFSQILQMPKMSREELTLAVPYEAANYIPLSIDKVYLDYQIISAHTNLKHIDLLMNAMPKSIIDSYVLCLKKAGLIPYILEVESCAIARSLLKSNTALAPSAIVDFGDDDTTFIVFSGNYIHFTSSMPISSKKLNKDIANKLGISVGQAEALNIKYGLSESKKGDHNVKGIIEPFLNDLAIQVKKYLSFYQGHIANEYFSFDAKIEKIILSGSGANIKDLSPFLAKELNVNVEVGNPLVNVLPLRKDIKQIFFPEKELSFAAALGLAIRGSNNNEHD